MHLQNLGKLKLKFEPINIFSAKLWENKCKSWEAPTPFLKLKLINTFYFRTELSRQTLQSKKVLKAAIILSQKRIYIFSQQVQMRFRSFPITRVPTHLFPYFHSIDMTLPKSDLLIFPLSPSLRA